MTPTPNQPPSVMSGRQAYMTLRRMWLEQDGVDPLNNKVFTTWRYLPFPRKMVWEALAAKIASRTIDVCAHDPAWARRDELDAANEALTTERAKSAKLHEELSVLTEAAEDVGRNPDANWAREKLSRAIVSANYTRQALETEERG